jgi:nucleoside-diphosphate-sugar epimerase
MNKTAFVTGASGFIGINLVKQLYEEGWDVTALYREQSNITHLSKLPVKLVKGDICEDNIISLIPKNTDAIFHVAANLNFNRVPDIQQDLTTINGTINVINASIKRKIKRFIYTSSLATYGAQNEVSINENSVSNALYIPLNYFRSKYLAEQEVLKAIEKGLDAVILNPAHVIGPHGGIVWISFVDSIVSGKLKTTPPGNSHFCHVEDIARAHITAFEKGRVGEKYLLGGVAASFEEIGNIVSEIMGSKTPTVSFEKDSSMTSEVFDLLSLNQIVDSTKAIKELDFKYGTLKEMILDLCIWMRKENLIE